MLNFLLISGLVAQTLSSSSSLMTFPIDSSYTTTIDQGDVFYSKETQLNGVIFVNNECTAGYVDKEANTVWTVAHCGNNGATVYNDRGENIGVLRHVVDNKGMYSIDKDRAYIELNPGVHAGDNVFSGDSVIEKAKDIKENDEVCFWSRIIEEVQCTHVVDVNVYPHDFLSNWVLLDNEVTSFEGDSGSPAWIKNGDYIGNISGKMSNGGVGIVTFDKEMRDYMY